MAKYKNKKAVVDGIIFDSKREARRYSELKLLEKAGEIYGLELQKVFVLVPAYFETTPTGEVYQKGEKKGQPKYKRTCIENAVKYKADFYYMRTKDNEEIVEDTKGFRTKEYIIKRKLLLYIYGIRIKEI